MRVSNINEFLGGADNVYALEMIQGEQRVLSGEITYGGEIADLTSYNLTAVAEFFNATVLTDRRSINVADVERNMDVLPKQLQTTKTDPEAGLYEVLIPTDLFVENVPIDLTEKVPIAVVYLGYDDGTTIRMSRILIVLRRGLLTA